MKDGGGKANRAGRLAEDVLAAILNGLGVQFQRQVTLGETIYGGRLRVDFLVFNFEQFPSGLVIESKWQDGDGSVDEKFPYLVENVKLYSLPTIIVVHGGGCRPGALQWLRNHCEGNLIAAYRLEEFISWAARAPKNLIAQQEIPL